MSLDYLNSSLEQARHQFDSNFVEAGKAAVGKLRALGRDKIVQVATVKDLSDQAKCTELVELQELINRRHNANFTIYIRPRLGLNAGTITPALTINHAFRGYFSTVMREAERRSFTATALDLLKGKKDGIVKGGIDLTTAKFYGFASEVEIPIILDADLLFTDVFTDGEILSTIEHEVGHTATYVENIGHVVTESVLMRAITEELADNQVDTVDVKLVNELSKLAKSSEFDVQTVLDEAKNSRAVITRVSAAAVVIQSTIGNPYNDINYWEMLCDQFSGRMGLYAELATANDKYARLGRSYELSSNTRHFFVCASQLAAEIMHTTFAVVVSVATAPMGLFFVGIVYQLIRLSNFVQNGKAYITPTTYDDPITRIKRTRGDIVSALRHVKGRKDWETKLMGDLDIVNGILDNMKERYDLYQHVWRFFASTYRQADDMRKEIVALEDLSNNQLFVSALKLSKV